MLPIKAVQALAKNIWNTFRSSLSIHSPSKVMEGEGKQVPAGVAQGITKNTKVAAKATKDLAKVVEENLTINKSKYEKMLDGLVTALKKRLEKQKDLRIKNIEAEMEAEEKASSRRLKMYEDEYNAKVKTLDDQSNSEIAALQAQIDAIEKAEEAREKAQEEAEYNSKVAALKEQILAAESAEDKADLEKDLADTIAAWEEKKRQEQVQAEKDSLQAQIDAIKEKADAEKEILQDQYDKRLMQRITALKQLRPVQTRRSPTGRSTMIPGLTMTVSTLRPVNWSWKVIRMRLSGSWRHTTLNGRMPGKVWPIPC